jgi:AbrB family looped-hinge helix DNA binding protein
MLKTRATATRISDKGQITLPKRLRERRGWTGGWEFIVEERPDGVFLRPAIAEVPTDVAATFGRLRPAKKAVTFADMQEAMLEEARRRWDVKMEGEG